MPVTMIMEDWRELASVCYKNMLSIHLARTKIVVAANEFVILARITMKGYGKAPVKTSSIGPIQKQNAINMPKPVQPLMKTVRIIARGITTAAFSISSAIVKSAKLAYTSSACNGF